MTNRFIAVTFYTEGPPWDAGTPLADVEKDFRASVSPYVDELLSFTPRSMAARWPNSKGSFRDYSDWLEQHPLRHQLRHYNRNWAKIGFQAWKPFLLHSLLHDEAFVAGDVLLYHDVNIRKYSSYARTPAEWRDVSLRILDELGCDFFCTAGSRLEMDAKAFLVRRYLNLAAGCERGVQGFLVAVRKSRQSIEFIDEWKQMCDDLDNVSPLPNPQPYAAALWHSPEQSVLGVLALMWKRQGRLPTDWPRYAAGDFSFDSEIFKRKMQPTKAIHRLLYRCYLTLPHTFQKSLLAAAMRLKRSLFFRGSA